MGRFPIGHEAHGEGEPLLLLTGWTRSRAFWHRSLPHLTGRFRCVLVDNRETGDTGPCPEGFTIEDLAADALSVLDHLGIEQAHVCGHSMGGMIAQALAVEAPQRVRSLAVVSSSGGGAGYHRVDPQTLIDWSSLQLPDDPVGAIDAIAIELIASLLGPASAEAARSIAAEEWHREAGTGASLEGMDRQVAAITSWDPGDAVAGLSMPITIVHGDADPLLPPVNAEELGRRLGVEPIWLAGVGHMVPWEAIDSLVDALVEVADRAGSS